VLVVDRFSEVAERCTEDERLPKLSDMLEEMTFRTPVKHKPASKLGSASRPIILDGDEQDEDSPTGRYPRAGIRSTNATRSILTNHVGFSKFIIPSPV
jgi:hypothetical protein